VIYLIGKIFAYLLCSLGLGIGAGWLWRNLQAAKREEALERQLLDVRSRLPQLENALRGSEDRLGGLRGALRERDETLATHIESLAARERALAEVERSNAELRERLAAGRMATAADSRPPAAADGDDLELHPGDPSEARPWLEAERDAAAEAPAAVAEAPAAVDHARIEELEAALSAAAAELAQARSALAAEQRRIDGLMRERELQNASLRALEQQLELVREERALAEVKRLAANG